MNIWKLIPHHEDPTAAMERVRQSCRVTIGWGLIGDVRQLLPEHEKIRAVVASAYPENGANNHHNGATALFDFVYGVADGDLVIVKHDNWEKSLVVQIIGDYGWLPTEAAFDDYQNYRPIKVLQSVGARELWNERGGNDAVVGNRHVTIVRLHAQGVPPPAEALAYLEGKPISSIQTFLERNSRARDACLAHHGYSCCICRVNFAEKYGQIGLGFIHVHHLNPIAQANGQRSVDPITDLVPVCPNCHAMLHTRNPPLTPGDLQTRLQP